MTTQWNVPTQPTAAIDPTIAGASSVQIAFCLIVASASQFLY